MFSGCVCDSQRTVCSVTFSGSDEFHSLASHVAAYLASDGLWLSSSSVVSGNFSTNRESEWKVLNFSLIRPGGGERETALLSWVKFGMALARAAYLVLIAHLNFSRLTSWTFMLFFSSVFHLLECCQPRCQGSHMCKFSQNSYKKWQTVWLILLTSCHLAMGNVRHNNSRLAAWHSDEMSAICVMCLLFR